MVKGRRITITIPADLERKLILWGFVRNESLTNWIKIVLQLRADENWSKVQELLRERANRLDMSVEELEQKVLKQAGFDFERELRELGEEFD